MFFRSICGFFLLLVIQLRSAEIAGITWPTEHAAPPAALKGAQKNLLPLVRMGVGLVPEARIMNLAFIGGRTLGLDAKKAAELHALVTKRYRKIRASELMKKAPSALPYCYAAKKPKTGFATVYRPEGANSKTPVILFLHGYGGSFLLYQSFLVEAFPNHLIICPAYGMSTSQISSEYLRECLVAVTKKMTFPIEKPLLVGLSAGGIGGFREYTRHADSYLGFIALAAPPPKEMIPKIPRQGILRVLAGEHEGFVKDKTLQRAGFTMRGRIKDYQSRIIAGQGHFFLLGADAETRKILVNWDQQIHDKAEPQ